MMTLYALTFLGVTAEAELKYILSSKDKVMCVKEDAVGFPPLAHCMGVISCVP